MSVADAPDMVGLFVLVVQLGRRLRLAHRVLHKVKWNKGWANWDRVNFWPCMQRISNALSLDIAAENFPSEIHSSNPVMGFAEDSHGRTTCITRSTRKPSTIST